MTADPAFDALRERLEDAEESARRLVHEATDAALRRSRPPAAGWEPARNSDAGSEAAALADLVATLRSAVPDELWDRLVEVVRELLAVLRALLDLALQRLTERRSTPVEVEEIPIV